MTYFIQIEPGPATSGPIKGAWHPCINCEPHPADLDRPSDQDIQLISHRHLRDRGGLADTETSYEFTIYSYSERTPKYANGMPMRCKSITMIAGSN